VGILTVCYGHTGSVQQGREYSMGECMGLLTADMQEALEIVTKAHPEAPERVLVAFSDAVFNIGPKIATDSQASSAARFLYAKQWDAACEQLPRWNKANVAGMLVPLPGLTARRQKELEFCKGAQA
ncbi:MAG: glycoside hydrolase family protein, partial [Rhodoferax sp.]|nr:glycoside hydrolase family protein [Rhodoferax sp.]